ncbi:MAG: YwbE family protein [Prolixibacteraceae bacterium]|nr:YwbE family protein [Prolixibacteraceae bacterium]
MSKGNYRKNIRQGTQVQIVLKRDQQTGDLTEGFVQQILTSSAFHPHGIKVRLSTGEVGRVKIIEEDENEA